MSLRQEGSAYRLACESGHVDVHRFTLLVSRATAEADPGRRLVLLEEALGLWRGPALADSAPEPVRARLSRHLDDARLTAMEHRLDALLQLGRYDIAINELAGLTDQHPERHRIIELLVTALHQAGRSGEALTVYREAKRRLVEDFGLDPPPYLQQLELAIMRNDTALPTPAVRTSMVPAQLPADVHAFTGREEALAQLDTLLISTPGQSTAVVISAVSGTAGVGKTALAVHWAHQTTDRFPDGQLYINLRGFDPTGRVVSSVEAVRSFLDTLGVPPERIPPGLDALTALYRSLLAGKRMLVVLDNARDADQVRPLLPGELAP